jgi:hypothetical protein
MLLSRNQNVSRNQDVKIANRSFENVSQFKYLGTTVTHQNVIQEEIKRDEETGEWRKFNNEELRDLYSSPGIIRIMTSRMRWAGHVARMGEMWTGLVWLRIRTGGELL